LGNIEFCIGENYIFTKKFLMKRTIFYSWQSDLSNSTNRGFIEECIEKAIKEIKNRLDIDFTLDKDTSGEPGNPEIANTIISKIENCKIFIADISIINSGSKQRKTPNPNVIFELGYAAKSLGWEKILCLYNLDYGTYEDLPFDLKYRRPIGYNLKNKSKSEVRKQIADLIVRNAVTLFEKGYIFDEVEDLLKMNVDTEILTIINHLHKIIYGYKEKPNIMQDANDLLNLTKAEIEQRLKTRTILGFQIFKSFETNYNSLKTIYENTISSTYYKREVSIIINKILDWISWYNAVTRSRTYPNMFNQSTEQFYKKLTIIPPEKGNRFLLCEHFCDEKYRVIDFGDISEKEKLKNALKFYLFADDRHLLVFVNVITKFIEIINLWLDKTNGEFILDTYRNFEMRNEKGEII